MSFDKILAKFFPLSSNFDTDEKQENKPHRCIAEMSAFDSLHAEEPSYNVETRRGECMVALILLEPALV